MTNPGSPQQSLEGPRATLRELGERFQLLIESVKDYAIFILDENGFVSTWNAGAESIKGYRADEIIGQHFSRFYVEAEIRAGKCEHELRTAIADGRFEDEGWRLRKDGSRFWANVVITTLRNPQGHVVGFAKVTRDLTDRRAAEDARVRLAETTAERQEAERSLQQLTRLQTLIGAIASAVTPEELAEVVVQRGVDALGAASGAFVRARGDRLCLTGVIGVSTAEAAAFHTFSSDLRIPSASAFRARKAEWVESREEFARRFPDAPDLNAPGAASCALPLFLGDRITGVIAFRFVEARSFAPIERAFMETFANQVAQALERTDAHVREIEARSRLEALSKLSEALASAVSTTDIANVIVGAGHGAVAAEVCLLYKIDKPTGELELVASHGVDPANPDGLRTITRSHPVYAAVTTGDAVWVENQRDEAAFLSMTNGSQRCSFWALPLVAEGKPLGMLAMGFLEPRDFPEEEREFVETFVRHGSEALLRAQRLEAERAARTVAEALHASLETTLRSIGDAVIATDNAGRVTVVNPVA
ncbi:MAG: luxQ 1, partial [Labilithrix sp.]|nr:luxQ 1 [Labilithrix sp.]